MSDGIGEKEETGMVEYIPPECFTSLDEVSNTGVVVAPETSPLARRLRSTQTTISFLRYREDNTLRLFKEGSILGTQPAGYADERVVVKARVQRPTEDYVVILTVKRQQLARTDAEEWLAWMAYEYRS